jgi:hypothetical protein
VSLCYHRNAWATWHLSGRPDSFLAVQKARYSAFGSAIRCLYGQPDWQNATAMALSPSVEWHLRPLGSANVTLVLQEELSRGQRLNESVFATGEPAILAENDINGSKISV